MNAVVISNLTLFCMGALALLPVVCAGIAKSKGFGKRRRDGGYDNHNPRAWLGKLEGWQARANAAQANTFEAMPFFYASVLAASLMGASAERVGWLSAAWLMLRLVYVGLYLADKANARSLVWIAALGLNFALMTAALW